MGHGSDLQHDRTSPMLGCTSSHRVHACHAVTVWHDMRARKPFRIKQHMITQAYPSFHDSKECSPTWSSPGNMGAGCGGTSTFHYYIYQHNIYSPPSRCHWLPRYQLTCRCLVTLVRLELRGNPEAPTRLQGHLAALQTCMACMHGN